MKCSKCGFENREGANFCGKCKSKLVQICLSCKTENPPENSFCDRCGHDLGQPREIASAPLDLTQPHSYTPKFLADKILTTRSSIEGERKVVTVLFADVANYTSLSEKLDPEEVHEIMDGCFKILMEQIHRYEGTINQFTGDGVMALFGAPIARRFVPGCRDYPWQCHLPEDSPAGRLGRETPRVRRGSPSGYPPRPKGDRSHEEKTAR